MLIGDNRLQPGLFLVGARVAVDDFENQLPGLLADPAVALDGSAEIVPGFAVRIRGQAACKARIFGGDVAAESLGTTLGQVHVVGVLAFRRGIGDDFQLLLTVERTTAVEAVQRTERFLVGKIIFVDNGIVERVVNPQFRLARSIVRA